MFAPPAITSPFNCTTFYSRTCNLLIAWDQRVTFFKIYRVALTHNFCYRNGWWTFKLHANYASRWAGYLLRSEMCVTLHSANSTHDLRFWRHTMIRHFSPYNFHQTFTLSTLIEINLCNYMNENTYWNLFRRLDVLYNEFLTCFWTRFCRRLRWTEQTRKALKLDIYRL